MSADDVARDLALAFVGRDGSAIVRRGRGGSRRRDRRRSSRAAARPRPRSRRRNQLRSTSARWRTRPSRFVSLPTNRARACSSVRPSSFVSHRRPVVVEELGERDPLVCARLGLGTAVAHVAGTLRRARSPGRSPLSACNTAAHGRDLASSRDGGVVRLTLNRPDKLNAQTVAMWHHMARLGAELAADDTIRVLVVAGAGRSFSAGHRHHARSRRRRRPSGLAVERCASVGRPPVRVRRRRHPRDPEGVHAGSRPLPTRRSPRCRAHAFGAGMQLALACDLRIAADDVRMGLLEAQLGPHARPRRHGVAPAARRARRRRSS